MTNSRHLPRLIVALPLLLACVAAVAQTSPQPANQARALIIGINEYRHIPPLKGAAADAQDIEKTLRNMGLEDVTALIDAGADRTHLVGALSGLVERAGPGDTVLIALAGQGAQEPERFRGSQPDGMDVVFLLPEFDPRDPKRNSEKVLDIEFKHYIKAIEGKGARVIFVADTSSGAGLTRAIDPRANEMSFRSVSYTSIPDTLEPVANRADAFLTQIDFQRSTLIGAADKQSKVAEINIPGVGYRGALSYGLARALEGAADLTGNGRMTVQEIAAYIRRVAYQLTDGRQQIVVSEPIGTTPERDLLVELSRGITVQPVGQSTSAMPAQHSSVIVSFLPPDQPPPAPTQTLRVANEVPPLPYPREPIRVASLDPRAGIPSGLQLGAPYEVVPPSAGPDLVWDATSHDIIVGGDVVAYAVQKDDLSGVIARTAAVRWIKLRAAKAPLSVQVLPNATLHRKGKQVEVEISGIAGRSLIVFNIAGNGTVQFLYPFGGDPAIIRDSDKFSIPVKVVEPFGADSIVAISASRRLPELERALVLLKNRRDPTKVADIINQYGADALVGMIGIFTAP